MSGSPEGRRLTLYVRSERAQSEPQWGALETTGVRLASMVVPAVVLRPRSSVTARMPPELENLQIPYDQAQCVRLVVDIAAQKNDVVQVVDVSGAGVSASDVERAIGTGGSYPILVRPDGAWLEGPEYFTPSRVRKFLH